jgi:tetratricopeptide (TPR) repeat protein
MYNIEALEEKWKRYNRKKKIPWLIVSIIGIAIVIFTYSMLDFNALRKDKIIKSTVSNTVSNEKNAKKKTVYIDKALRDLENKKSVKMIDAPMDTDEVESIQESSPKKSQSIIKRPHKKLHIEVIDAVEKNSRSYKEIAKRFRLTHDTDDSLFLAKAYYKKGMYKKAEYWALQTNKINENIEESWLIFIKAKIKRGQKNEALRILNAYIKKTNSVEAKVILEKIKKGKL